MRTIRRALSTCLFAVLLVSAVGCGNSMYLLRIQAAEERLQEARQLRADQHSAYEYFGAEARVAEARRQAAEAEYGAACDLADEAEALASTAVKKSKAAHAGVAP